MFIEMGEPRMDSCRLAREHGGAARAAPDSERQGVVGTRIRTRFRVYGFGFREETE